MFPRSLGALTSLRDGPDVVALIVSVSSHPAPLSWPVSAINLGADVGGQLPVNGTNLGQPA